MLIAHEPPAVVQLPDAASWLAFFDGVYETYRKHGIPKTMQQFGSSILGSGDIQVLEQVRREHTNEEALASVSVINLPSPRPNSSWRRSCPAISSASCQERA